MPTIIISPFAKRHFVDHTTADTTSILKLIETRWYLGTTRRSRCSCSRSYESHFNWTDGEIGRCCPPDIVDSGQL